jgi:hypothetical protein
MTYASPQCKLPHLTQRIWGEWQKAAFKACDDSVRSYWVCRQEQGMLTPFKCRSENRAMNDCLGVRVRDEEKFEGFKARQMVQIEAEAQQAAAGRAPGTGSQGGGGPGSGSSGARR